MHADLAAFEAYAPPARKLDTLVGFVGPELQPGSELRTTLAAAQVRCLWLPTQAEALRAANQAVFDALLVDSREVEADPATLMSLRAAFACPLVVLAQRVNDIDEIMTLELGADAYLAQSSPARLLRARLQALMRPLRSTSAGVMDGAPGRRRVEFAGWWLDRVGNSMARHDKVLSLTEVQCALLQCLMLAQGSIVSRERLAAALRHAPDLGARSIDVYIHRLRKRLDAPIATGLTVATERGRGYRLVSQSG
jgi:DNA-binding response OmpR family regulator